MMANPRRFAAGAVSLVALILLAACSDDPSTASAPDNGDAGACADGIWNNDECGAWSTCAAGTYVASAPSAKADRTCASCTSGTFSATANAESCTTWTTCKPGSYVATPGSTTTDQVCAPCAEGTYSSSNNQAKCVPLGECPAGSVQKTTGGSTSPPVCAACDAGNHCAGGKATAQVCASGTWDHDMNPATACVAWTACLAGQAHSEEGSATTNRTCTACAVGSFSTTTNAASCTPMTNCAPGSFVSTAGTPVADRQCSSCPAGQASTTTNATTCIPGNLKVSISRMHACARLTDGSVRCWGSNGSGAIGDGTTDIRLTPVAVSNLSDASDVAVGVGFSCAVVTGGAVRCWGMNFWGSVGDGTTTDRLTPTAVPGIEGVKKLALGGGTSCVIVGDDNTLRCWGRLAKGIPLGDGTTADGLTPVAIPGLSDVTAVAVADTHACALLGNRTVRCWGDNSSGQLGDGTTTQPATLTTAVSGLSTAVGISAGDRRTCALLDDGTVRCWGNNSFYSLGDGTTNNTRSSPVEVLGLSGVAEIVATGSFHSCARLTNGGVRCWGYNEYGQVGDGTEEFVRPSPTPVVGISTAIGLAVGGEMACVVLAKGTVQCWGASEYASIGNGTEQSLVPVPIPL